MWIFWTYPLIWKMTARNLSTSQTVPYSMWILVATTPPNILKNIPDSVNKRLNSISKSEEVFKSSILPYQEALNNAGHKYKLHYAQPNPQRNNKNRSRNIIWYNPPFCRSVKTNIGKEFFKIMEKCFPAEHKLHKIFNKNTVKVSYSTMPNLGRLISGHNMKILGGQILPPPCTCTQYECPVGGRCETRGIVYQCKVTESESGKSESYIGLSERSFKDRYTKHRASFRNEHYQKNSLSTHVWGLKKKNVNFELSWRIVSEARPYSPSSQSCELCLREIYHIMYDKVKSSLNKRKEFFGYCLHKDKYLLSNQ